MLTRLAGLLAAILLLASIVAALDSVWASAGHAPGACPIQAWDEKTGPAELWWKTVTACNDHPAEELQHNVFLQRFDWNDWSWHEALVVGVGPVYGEAQDNTDFIAASRFREVIPSPDPSVYGHTCYRVRVHHFITESAKGLQNHANTYSLGQCF